MIKQSAFITYSMISLKNIRENTESLCSSLSLKNFDISHIQRILKHDAEWRKRIIEVEKLKEERNIASREISELKKLKKPTNKIVKKMQSVSMKIKNIDANNDNIKTQIDQMLLEIPNTPDSSVPVGKGEEENVFVREWGNKPKFDFKN